ncbi:GAF domain-containing protein [Halobellus salinus]|uniref:GAF domain-containing protein n=1 Tax=Halobellus salinus TaxID=931585 RepID=UPI001662BD87|nr:GAF domain-containing protein [Halobellus salinus]SMP32695.1 GAF domain-containing protein [Halobellus salinus]
MTDDPVGGRVLVVSPSEPGDRSDDGSFVRGGDAPGTDAGGAGSADGGGSPDRGSDPDTVAAGIADRLPVEVVLRDERTAGEYLEELGPTIDCVVVLGSNTGPLGCLPDDVSIPAVVCERPVAGAGGAEGATGIPVAAVAARVRAVVRETRWRSDLQDQNTRLTALSRYAGDITGCETVDAVLDRTVAAVTDALAFDHCVVLFPDGDRLVPRASALPDPELRHIGVTEGVAGRTLSTGEAEIVADVQSDPDAVINHDDLHALLSVPIGSRGVLQIASRARNAFDERDEEFTEILAGYTREALARLEREVTLRAERDRLHALYAAIPVPVVCVERHEKETTVVEANSAYEEVFPGNPTGQSLSTAVPTEAERGRYEAALNGEGESQGSVIRRVGSREEPVALAVIPVTPPDGSHYAFGVYRTEPVDGGAGETG